MSTQYAVETKGLCKDYRITRSLGQVLRQPLSQASRLRALNEVSLQISYGQIVAVVGLNGAGKTTLLKVLCDLLLPTAGQVNVVGYALPDDGMAVRLRVGFVPSDERSFFWRLSARENLEFFAALYRVPRRLATRRIDELVACFGLAGKGGGHFRDYSSGMRKRLAIIRGFLHEPQILIMDEPTNSLDPQWDQYLRDYARRWVKARPGRSLVWSTHRMEEVAELGDDVLRLDAGRLADQESGDAAIQAGFAAESPSRPDRGKQ